MASALNEKRKEKFGDSVYYYKEGETAYCVFNSFLCDDSGWRKYYKGESPKPTLKDYPHDDLLILLDALEKAENDPSADGFGYRYSTHRHRMANTANENIDSGIEPTYLLETVDDFYDIPKVTELIKNYYSK